jgi:hypothetical protein
LLPMTGGGFLGFRNLMFPLWFALLGGSVIFLDVVGPSNLYLVFPPFLGALVYLWLAGFHHHFCAHSCQSHFDCMYYVFFLNQATNFMMSRKSCYCNGPVKLHTQVLKFFSKFHAMIYELLI